MDAFIGLFLTLGLLVVTYFVGSSIERAHYQDIRQRERKLRTLPAINFRTLPPGWEARESGMVMGSVVISVDYFKRFLASLRMFIGGPVRSYETILDRARREAILRMKEDALRAGFDSVINVRLETSRLASSRADGKGVAGLEILAYGTGLKRGE